MMRKRILLLALPAWLLVAPYASGDEFQVVPSLTAREEYNSNIYLTKDDIKRDFITTISPALKVVKKTERLDSELQARVDRRDYVDNRDISATDQNYRGKLRYMPTPLFGVTGEAAYITDTRPDRDIETTGMVLSALRRQQVKASAGMDYMITEKTQAAVSYAYVKEDYESKYSPYTSQSVNGGLEYDFSRHISGTKIRINGGYEHYDFTTSTLDNTSATVGLTKMFTEALSLALDGGGIYTQSKFTIYNEQTNNQWGWVGNVALKYKGERGTGEIGYNRSVSAASMYGGAVERNAVTMNGRYRIAYELSSAISAGFFTNKSDPYQYSRTGTDTRSYYVAPSLRYEFTRDVALDVSYNYTLSDDRLSDIRADRQLVMLMLTLQHTFFE